MSVVDEFLEHYVREIDHFAAAARAVNQRIEDALTVHGVRAIVTSRAKGIKRLRDKVEKRNRIKRYKTEKDIYNDIIDLSGVRVALYFPGDRDKVGSIIEELFTQARRPKTFPEKSRPKTGKRFAGYVATHYLVRLKPEDNSQAENRYANTKVEIQVASVLMHGWAEVEHDLEYKPGSGEISEDESAILDELNGLVLTGELALERLQRAILRRVGKDDQEFRNQFELASYLSQRATKEGMDDKDVGRVDALLAALRYLHMATPSKVGTISANLDKDEKKRPIADVLIDRLIAKTKRGANQLAKILSSVLGANTSGPLVDEKTQAIGAFLVAWQELEKLVSHLAGSRGHDRSTPFYVTLRGAKIGKNLLLRLRGTASLRNSVVHGTFASSTKVLEAATETIKTELIPDVKDLIKRREKLQNRLPPQIPPPHNPFDPSSK